MANFVIVVDPDSDRRARALRSMEPILPLTEGLVTGRCASGDFLAAWAAALRAPVSRYVGAAGATVVWGPPV